MKIPKTGFILLCCQHCKLFLPSKKNIRKQFGYNIISNGGVYHSSRKLYLLTTNRLTLDENLIGRPGRIRYIKQFGILPLNAVNDYIDDCLVDKSLKRVADWLGQQVKGQHPSFDNISLIEDEFNCHICKRNVIRIGDCIKDGYFDDGDIILCEPDEHGFFEVLDDCENAPQLCCISKDYGVHSIYKGRLKS